MDNQKPNDGSARDTAREGAAGNMGKDLGAGNTGKEMATGATGNAGNIGKDLGAGNVAGELNKDIAAGAANLHQGVDKVVDKAVETVRPMAERLATSAHAGVDKVSDALVGANQAVDNKARQLADAYQHFADTGRDYVRTRPVLSVLAALAAGYALSMLTGRRR